MTPWQNRVTELTRRMADDMKLRNYSQSTIDAYTYHLGKGQKTRLVPMSPRLLTELRAYWKVYRPPEYLFPGKTPDVPLSPTTIQKMCQARLEE